LLIPSFLKKSSKSSKKVLCPIYRIESFNVLPSCYSVNELFGFA
jgi:hypothetical protein